MSDRPTFERTFVVDQAGVRRQVVTRVDPVKPAAKRDPATPAKTPGPSKSRKPSVEPDVGDAHEPGDELAESESAGRR